MKLGVRKRIFALLVPYALACTLSMGMRPEPGALIAPLLGPWAGLAFGHSDCTMASVMPLPSWLLATVGVALLVGYTRARSATSAGWIFGVSVVWAIAWELAALLSVVNSTS